MVYNFTTNITIRVQNGRRAQNGWLQIPKISPLFWTFAPNTFLVFPNTFLVFP